MKTELLTKNNELQDTAHSDVLEKRRNSNEEKPPSARQERDSFVRHRAFNDDSLKNGLLIPLKGEIEPLLRVLHVGRLNLLGAINIYNVIVATDKIVAEDSNRFRMVNPLQELVPTTSADLIGKGIKGQFEALFGEVLNEFGITEEYKGEPDDLPKVKGILRKTTLSIMIRYIQTHRHARSFTRETDMFVNESSLELSEQHASFTMAYRDVMEQLGETGKEHLTAVMQDFSEHFPEFNDFIDILCAARFAPDRRKAFLWLHCPPQWGKGLLMSALKKLKLASELSGKDVESAFEGRPVGLDPQDLARSWVLIFDEVKRVKAEMKQLTNEISLCPKYQMRTSVPVYLKLFLSAEGIDSLAGCEGVEEQFSDRFSYMQGRGRVSNRKLFQDLGSHIYLNALALGIGEKINLYVEAMRSIGCDQAFKNAEDNLKLLHAAHKITLHHDSLDEMLKGHAADLHDLIIDWGKNKDICMTPSSIATLPIDLQKRLSGSFCTGFIGENKDPVYYLKSPVSFVKSWINYRVNRGEVVKVVYKAHQICDMVSVQPINKTSSVYKNSTDSQRQLVKALVVYRDPAKNKPVVSTVPRSEDVNFYSIPA